MSVLCNKTIFYEKPPNICIDQHMKLTETGVISIILYSILFTFSSICNLTMIVHKLREIKISKKRSSLGSYMIHLNISNLIITFITIPIEIGWKFTVYWNAGKFGCKFFQFLRPIGIYLSSFILIGLCLDRYYAIIHPIRRNFKRTKILIFSSWFFSILFSIPQIFAFTTKTHPIHKWYTQCLDFKFYLQLENENSEKLRLYEIIFLIYQIFVSIITFFLPLAVILFTFSAIILKIISKLKSSNDSFSDCGALSSSFRKKAEHDNNLNYSMNRRDTIQRAKKRTLKLAILIVGMFLICWTPYYSISVWFWIDQKNASKSDERIYNFLFIFAVSNCLANPLVYGLTSLNQTKNNKNDIIISTSRPLDHSIRFKSISQRSIGRSFKIDQSFV